MHANWPAHAGGGNVKLRKRSGMSNERADETDPVEEPSTLGNGPLKFERWHEDREAIPANGVQRRGRDQSEVGWRWLVRNGGDSAHPFHAGTDPALPNHLQNQPSTATVDSISASSNATEAAAAPSPERTRSRSLGARSMPRTASAALP
jgi:hypothetical protein